MHKTDKNQSKKPLFARFLQAQELRDATGGVAAVTQKFPSDWEDHSGPTGGPDAEV